MYVNMPVLMRTLHAHEDKLYLGRWPSRRKGKNMIVRKQLIFGLFYNDQDNADPGSSCPDWSSYKLHLRHVSVNFT